MAPTAPPLERPLGPSVLFVCHGNLCRSPLAAALYERAWARVGGGPLKIASAGIYAREGAPPHPLAIEVAAELGLVLGGPARQLLARDLAEFDEVLALDRAVLQFMAPMTAPSAFGAREGLRARVRLLRPLADPGASPDVPDPVRGDLAAFRACRDLLDRCCLALARQLAAGARAGPPADR